MSIDGGTSLVCLIGERNLLGDLNPKPFEPDDFAGMIGQQVDCREAQVRENLSTNSGIVLDMLMSDMGRECGLITPVRQQLPVPVTRHTLQTGSRLMQIEEDAVRG